MANIHLIGTIHYELNGTKRLKKALQVEKPGILTVEASQKWLDYLDKHWYLDLEMCIQTIKEKGFSQQAYSFFEDYLKSASNYEIDVCREYSNQTDTPLHLIDDIRMVNRLRQETLSQFQLFFKNIDPITLDKISRNSVIRGHDAIYQIIQKLYDGEIPAIFGEQQLINPARGKLIGKRDETEARTLIELAQDNDAKIVHVGGCAHNLTDSKGETLYSRLKPLNPTRATLLSYDK